jgi:hypothetical protein
MARDPGNRDSAGSWEAGAESRKRGQNLAILVTLLGFCALLFAITIVKMAHL